MSDNFSFWDVMVAIFWFSLLLSWISLLVQILADVFRDRTTSGATKAMWTLFIVVVPWLGALFYIFSRGDSMHERSNQVASRPAQPDAQPAPAKVSDELRGLAELRDTGVLSPLEYDQAKAKVLA